MYRIKIISVNKTKETWLEEAIAEYLKRLSQVATIEFIFCKSDEQLISQVVKEPLVICLDAAGELMDSERFSTFLVKKLEEGGSRLSIVIGGAEGLPTALKNHYPLISLSKMTFTHQVVRLILVEQVYRAFEIAKGSRYHK